MTLTEIQAHNIVAAALKTNREYRDSVKWEFKQAFLHSHLSRHPDAKRADIDAVSEEAFERFLTNFTK